MPIDPKTGIPAHDPDTLETVIAGAVHRRRGGRGLRREQGVHRERALSRRQDRRAPARAAGAASPAPERRARYLSRFEAASPCGSAPHPAAPTSSRRDRRMPASTQPDVMEKLVSLAKRRGFIFQSSEIYGGTGSVWDYGPLGVELKKNLKDRGGTRWCARATTSRARRGDPHASARVGGERPRRRLHRSARRLQDVQRRASAPTSSRTRAARRSRASGRVRRSSASSPSRACSTSCSRRSWVRSRRARRPCICARRRRRAST